jgi:predicted TIM-barrel fold metal-dependent hydrolase
MANIDAIDSMCRIFYAQPERAEKLFAMDEFQALLQTTFSGVADRHDVTEGEEWRLFELFGHTNEAKLFEEMDRVGVEKVFIDEVIQWFSSDSEAVTLIEIGELAALADDSGGRIVPGVSYNPFQIEESLARIERAVENHDFKYVWFHPMTFGLRPSDERCYPLYTKCLELDVPVCFQTGQSAEPLESEPGHPMYADKAAMDFPSVTFVLTHTGWPWTDEWCSMLWRYPNVYGNIGAYFPSFLPDKQVEFIDGRIRDKVLWATNGLGLERCKREFLALDLEHATNRSVLRENALKIFDI